MKQSYIAKLAYILKDNKKHDREGAVVFLGAGASVTGGIPLAGEIIKEILTQFGDNPDIEKLSADDKRNYYKLMEALEAHQRKSLFKDYIDHANINVTHLYLAQLMAEGYVDYILTVNFDNLPQRALALFNVFPAAYDIAMLDGLTTSTFDNPGIVFLHGQHHGFNLLNTESGFNKAKKLITTSLQRICGRPWIIVGYSGEDPVFDYIAELGSFDKGGLYWITYKDKDPLTKVKKHLLDKEHTNAYAIKGHEADTFFFELHSKLDLDQPEIITRPFTHIQRLQENITDIADIDEYKGMKERLEITKRWIQDAINVYEERKHADESMHKMAIDALRLDIINARINKQYQLLDELETKTHEYAEEDFTEALSDAYFNWGYDLGLEAEHIREKDKSGYERLLKESLEKFKKASIFRPNEAMIQYNCGITVDRLSQIAENDKMRELLNIAMDYYKRATEIDPAFTNAYTNWGAALSTIADSEEGEGKQALLNLSIEKYQKATELNPNEEYAFYNIAIALFSLAQMENEEQKLDLLFKSIDACKKVIEIDPTYAHAYYQWASALGDISYSKEGEEKEKFLKSSIALYDKGASIEITSDSNYHFNRALSYDNLAQEASDEDKIQYFEKAIESYAKAIELKPTHTAACNNLGSVFAKLSVLKPANEKEELLLNSVVYYKKAIKNDPDYLGAYLNCGISFDLLAQLKTDQEKENFLREGIAMYERVLELDPAHLDAYGNITNDYIALFQQVGGDHGRKLLSDALPLFEKGAKLGNVYNLACAHALLLNDELAFRYLADSLESSQITFKHVEQDLDWNSWREDHRYLELKKRYLNN